MKSVDEHLQGVLNGIQPLEPLGVPLVEALGCVIAEDVTAQWPLPSFDNSSMDGYAVVAHDIATASPEAPVQLTVIDDVPAGHRATEWVRTGTAIRIMTGALMPEGADAVVPVEWTDGGQATVSVTRPASLGSYIRLTGEDVAQGAVVISRGEVVGPRQIALLAAVGRSHVKVHPRPRVVIVSTGTELVDPGTPLEPGLVADSNGVMLVAAARAAGADAFRVGPVLDDAATLMQVLEDQLIRADLIITTGGVSMGAYDTVKEVLSGLGTVEFGKVAMQPGMPQGHGRLGADAIPIITLPGNPVSSYVSFEVFARPVIRRMLGFIRVGRPTIRAVSAGRFTSPEGKTQYARAQLRVEDGRYVVHPVSGQGSHMLGDLAKANALVVVPPEVTVVEPGDVVSVMDLEQEA